MQNKLENKKIHTNLWSKEFKEKNSVYKYLVADRRIIIKFVLEAMQVSKHSLAWGWSPVAILYDP